MCAACVVPRASRASAALQQIIGPIIGWKVDTKSLRAVPFGANDKPLPALDLRPLFQAYYHQTGDISDEVRQELRRLLPLAALRGGSYW
jgi:hypothetical protein